jgi:hypothetical protein
MKMSRCNRLFRKKTSQIEFILLNSYISGDNVHYDGFIVLNSKNISSNELGTNGYAHLEDGELETILDG